MTAEVAIQMSRDEIRAARRRIAEEAAKADEQTRKVRLAQKKALVGEIETVEAGKGGVKANLKRFFRKGRTWEADHEPAAAAPDLSGPPPPGRSAVGRKPWDPRRDATAAPSGPAREPASVTKIGEDQRKVFENAEKSVPSLFAGRSRGGTPSRVTPSDDAGGGGATITTAAEREAVGKLRPRGWDGKTHYGLKDLRQRNTPPIDMKNREQYLSPDDFREAFGMTKGAFCLLPKWKRDRLKQSLHLH
mmetsp:Transcript_2829/g.7765  ORF Transcript_2829/g.7765 Transcript_2829/m.7765 type:complete len:247 (+) Transcript_2829:153-893(+)